MQRLLIKDAIGKVGEDVLIKGWVKTRRDHGKLIFFDIYDRSGILQVIFNEKVSEEAYAIADSARPQYVVQVHGKINQRPANSVNENLPTGKIELEAKEISLLAKAESLPFDIDAEKLNLELPTLLDFRSLTLRHPKVKEIFKVQEEVAEGFRKAAKKLDCTEIFIPTISASATEGGAEVFPIDYYGYKAYLSQSPQLYKQMMVPIFERVYTFSHAYRAEPSVTTRHLSEVVQMDCEFGFADFGTLLDYLEEVTVAMLKHVEESCSEILKRESTPILFGKIPRLTLKEAQEIIFEETGRDNRGEKDLAPQDEIDICQWAVKKHQSDMVTITHFPTGKRAFYTMPDPKNPEYSLSYDILFKGVEIASGSQRINDYQELIKTIKQRGLNPRNFEMYLMAFKYGMPPEGGFSFGLERITMHLLNLPNIREASLFPRDMERVDERLSVVQEAGKVNKTS